MSNPPCVDFRVWNWLAVGVSQAFGQRTGPHIASELGKDSRLYLSVSRVASFSLKLSLEQLAEA